jgi:hypothetical protein
MTLRELKEEARFLRREIKDKIVSIDVATGLHCWNTLPRMTDELIALRNRLRPIERELRKLKKNRQ